MQPTSISESSRAATHIFTDLKVQSTRFLPARSYGMIAQAIVHILLEEADVLPPQMEASVHLPPRSRVWVASFTGAEPGKQVWRSTGLTDRPQAQLVANKWEIEARLQRASGQGFKKPTIRVRQDSPRGQLTQKDVAIVLKMSIRGVREVERRAFKKLRDHPLLREIWRQYLAGDLDEQATEPLKRRHPCLPADYARSKGNRELSTVDS